MAAKVGIGVDQYSHILDASRKGSYELRAASFEQRRCLQLAARSQLLCLSGRNSTYPEPR
jgi:hypothetical protein